ncbi:MAG: hypothetical protein GW763_14030 [Paraglaciecola sp.]|nr:hypothetical protein [Paraglaciecola sp.]NCT49073.1 hypothetical protein [Paraglaciecola sp.]
MAKAVYLISGIPRSGTTLCCKLLNERHDTVALHEPIDPQSIISQTNKTDVVEQIAQQISSLDWAICQGLSFTHGAKGGLILDNPVGQHASNGVRNVVAQRGQIKLAARDANSFHLIIKQNAFFTALLSDLTKHYSLVCIVRNPVDVLLSWLTVDLPVNRGRLPAGERFDAELAAALKDKSVSERQLLILQWFFDQFHRSGLAVVRYEDVIASDGRVLDESLGLPATHRSPLHKMQRQFSAKVLTDMELMLPAIVALNCYGWYAPSDIHQAFAEIARV